MPDTYNLYDAKTHLSELVDRAVAGEQIIIARAGVPQAVLMPLSAKTEKPKRVPGRFEGQIWYSEDAFSPEVDAEIAAEFEASEIFPPEDDEKHS